MQSEDATWTCMMNTQWRLGHPELEPVVEDQDGDAFTSRYLEEAAAYQLEKALGESLAAEPGNADAPAAPGRAGSAPWGGPAGRAAASRVDCFVLPKAAPRAAHAAREAASQPYPQKAPLAQKAPPPVLRLPAAAPPPVPAVAPPPPKQEGPALPPGLPVHYMRSQNPMEGYIVPTAAPPACPECGSAMQRRSARRGGHFWGCIQYPKCTATRRPHERG